MKLKYSKPVMLVALAASVAIVTPLVTGTKSEKEVSVTTTTTQIVPNTVVITYPPTTTVAPSTTTTTTLPDLSGVNWVELGRSMYGKCGEWHDLAISVGWPEEQWENLQIVMWRESRCQPDAWNGHDAGLMQINQIHRAWLSDFGWSHPESMFDPQNNLTFAFRLWETSGWKPWKATSQFLK